MADRLAREFCISKDSYGKVVIQSLGPDFKVSEAFNVIEKAAFDQLKVKLQEARDENEELMKEDYWSGRCRIAQTQAHKLAKLLDQFLDHYDRRNFTNGFHDILAIGVRKGLKEYRGQKW